MCRTCSTNGGEEGCIWDIGGIARRKETTRRTGRWRLDNINMGLMLDRTGDMCWIDVAQDRVMNFRVP
jgi:hypothetical protein